MTSISTARISGLQARDARGIVAVKTAAIEAFGIRVIVDSPFASIEVRPGEDTIVPLQLPGVRRNSNLQTLTATLFVASATRAASHSTGVTITPSPGSAGSFEVEVDGATRPSAVSLRLRDGPVFWTFGGPLAESSYELPDFAAAANEYLDRLPAGTETVTLELVVQSATAGKVGITRAEYRHTLIQTESWPNEADGTLRVDRTFDLDFGTAHALPLSSLADGPSARLHRVSVDVAAQVAAERLLGEVQAPGAEQATVGGDYAVAQPVSPNVAVTAAGVAAWFQADESARLYVELQSDAGGSPAFGAPLARGEFTIESGSAGWNSALFEAPAELVADSPIWVALRAIQGRARVALAPAEELQLSLRVNRGGPLWRPISPTPALGLVSLLYVPGPDNNTAALELTAVQESGTTVLQRYDPLNAPVPVQFDFPGASAGDVTLVIRSRARGQVTVANVVQEYTLA